ncbi:Putative site-specific recombinase Gcr [Methylophilaceae bacterium]
MFCRLKKSATCNPFNRREYFELMRSAVDAGIIIATMSMIKILFAQLHLAPLTETILFSLNYGFVDSHFYTSLWPSNSLPSLF